MNKWTCMCNTSGFFNQRNQSSIDLDFFDLHASGVWKSDVCIPLSSYTSQLQNRLQKHPADCSFIFDCFIPLWRCSNEEAAVYRRNERMGAICSVTISQGTSSIRTHVENCTIGTRSMDDWLPTRGGWAWHDDGAEIESMGTKNIKSTTALGHHICGGFIPPWAIIYTDWSDSMS